jgi:hypothetical protein
MIIKAKLLPEQAKQQQQQGLLQQQNPGAQQQMGRWATQVVICLCLIQDKLLMRGLLQMIDKIGRAALFAKSHFTTALNSAKELTGKSLYKARGITNKVVATNAKIKKA